ncbi:MAG: excinuclease ABC subunit UvrC [Firmicutes bacterium]|nr:excinuclease ABC subunit UvrC [Bacillota bacterium]
MDLEEQLRLLPDRPGVYIFRDAAGRILYVGKARSLRHRVRQYFQASRNLPPKVQVMVPQIAQIEHIVTDNEVEALILESNLIKRHKPRYNIRLRDDKHYPYIRLTLHEEWPRVLIARQMRKDGSRYFGPYTASGSVHETLKLLRRLFPLRTCSDPSRYPRACLQWHIGRCLAPCLPQVDREAYMQAVRDVEAFLEGKVDDVLRRLRQQMEEAAERLEFERAAEIRDRIRAVEQIAERQKIITDDMQDRDVIACAVEQDEACVQVFFVRQGKLVGRDSFVLTSVEGQSPGEILGAFLQQHYNRTNFIPPEILVAERPPEAELLEEWLSQKRGSRVRLHAPKRGEKRRLVELVIQNAQEAMVERRSQRERDLAATRGALEELQQALGLPTVPYRIECYDISHVQGTDVVAAMVVFEDGVPKKSDYRKFKIRVDQNNDFASMAEVITRRFRRGLAEREALAAAAAGAQAPAAEGKGGSLAAPGAQVPADGEALAAEAPAAYPGDGGGDRTRRGGRRTAAEPKFAAFPDLVIIDGGKGQLSAAREAMRALGVADIPTFALAKEEEVLFREGDPEPIVLPRGSHALHLLQRIRDEAHRFAVTFHRTLHRKGMRRSLLDEAPGIGPKRKQALLRHFGSLRRIREASVEELAAVPGMTREAAERLVEFLENAPDE